MIIEIDSIFERSFTWKAITKGEPFENLAPERQLQGAELSEDERQLLIEAGYGSYLFFRKNEGYSVSMLKEKVIQVLGEPSENEIRD